MSDLDRMLGDSLKGIRDEHLKRIEAQVPAARREIGDKLRGRRFRFVIGGVAVAAAAVAAIVFVAQTVPNVDRSAPIRPAGVPVVMARIDVPQVGVMEPGFDRLWVSHEDGLVGIDPSTSAIDQDWPVRNVDGMAMNSEAMYTIDMDDRKINRLGLGNNEAAFAVPMEGTPTVIAASEETVWVAAAVGPVGDSQIFAYTPELEEPGDSAVQVEGRVVADMTYVDDSLWMTAAVSRGEPEAETSSSQYEVHRYTNGGTIGMARGLSTEGSVADIVVGEGAAWVLRQPTKDGGNTITRIDVETHEVVERAVSFRESIESIAVGEGYLWVTTAPLGMDMPRDAQATLYRIDPTTLEAVGEPLKVSGPGSKLAVGSGFVWVGDPNAKQIVQIDPSGEVAPEPEPVETPEPEETETSQDPPECRTFLPFASSDSEFTLELGSGGQVGVPLQDQSPAALVHFAGPEVGSFVDVTTGDPIWPPFDEEPIRVLETRGTLHAIEDGYAVTFGLGGCHFQLIAYGLDEAQVKTFVDSLGLRGHLDPAYDAFTLWPETTPEAAYGACLDAAGSALEDPEATALGFAESALRWKSAEMGQGLILNSKAGWRGYDIVRDGSKGAPRVMVMVREVAADCWHVLSVRTMQEGVPYEGRSGLSISSTDGKTRVAFDLEREAAGQAVDSLRLIVGQGEVLLYKDEFERTGFIELTDAPLEEPKALLVLLFDENREVVGAIGQALPSSNYSAG